MPLIELRQVCKYFRAGTRAEVRALDEVSMAVEPGSFVVVTGPSGSGKTTLLALLGAMERPSRGQVLFEGKDLTGCSDVELARTRRRVGFVFQDFALIPNLPAWENITYPLIPRGVGGGERYRLAEALLGRFGLADKFSSRPAELSGGEQQRVAVARALAGKPDLLLADEPTSNLDPEAGELLISMFKEIHSEGKTIVLSSHDVRWGALATVMYELREGILKTK